MQTTTKGIEVTKQLSLNEFTSNIIEQVRSYVRNREPGSIRQLEHFNLTSPVDLEIDQHSLDRWNERVGPIITNLEELKKTIKFMHGCRRIKLYDKQNIGTIDDDILFTFKYSRGGKITITTFYGRVSLVHYLSNFEVLRKYNRASGDNVALSHSVEVLNSQSLVTHKQIMFFNGTQHRYALEVFDVNGSDVVYISTISGYKGGTILEIFPDTVSLSVQINSSMLSALREAGYGDFVSDYISAFRAQRHAERFDPIGEVTLGA